MPELTVTETQRETLAEIRSDLEAAYIDTYGHIRTEDVLQYLLDTYTPPDQQAREADHERIATAEFARLQEVATDVEGVPGSGIDTETMRGELLSALGVEEFAARLAALDDAEEGADGGGATDEADAADADGEADDLTGEADGDEDADGEGDDPTEEADEDADDENEADADVDEGDSDGATDSTPDTDSPGSILSAANQLLADHDDKWREGGSDEPYEVDLPDGTTKKVRTKDDIRQVLFKHY